MGKKRKVDAKKVRKGFFKGFKDFIARGNILDLAVGVVIGGAFGKIVTSLVNDIIMPPIGLLLGNTEVKNLVWVLRTEEINAAGEILKPAITMNYGNFIMMIVECLIIAFSIYAVLTLVIRRRQFIEELEAEEKAKLEAEQKVEKEKVVPEDIQLLREIRDHLKNEESRK